MEKKALGKLSETLACRYLISQGYKIVLRNYRFRYGEIDIIALKSEALVFIEVRSRRGGSVGFAEASFTPKKLHKIKLLASLYATTNNISAFTDQKFDGICIRYAPDMSAAHLKHYKDIFQFY